MWDPNCLQGCFLWYSILFCIYMCFGYRRVKCNTGSIIRMRELSYTQFRCVVFWDVLVCASSYIASLVEMEMPSPGQTMLLTFYTILRGTHKNVKSGFYCNHCHENLQGDTGCLQYWHELSREKLEIKISQLNQHIYCLLLGST
jgi:hypothetical protein